MNGDDGNEIDIAAPLSFSLSLMIMMKIHIFAFHRNPPQFECTFKKITSLHALHHDMHEQEL